MTDEGLPDGFLHALKNQSDQYEPFDTSEEVEGWDGFEVADLWVKFEGRRTVLFADCKEDGCDGEARRTVPNNHGAELGSLKCRECGAKHTISVTLD